MRILTIFLILLIVPVNATSTNSLRNTSSVSTERIEQFVRDQLDLGPRIPGSEGSRNFRGWIENLYSSSNTWEVKSQVFEYRNVTATNILIKSKGMEFPKYLIGAHYDTRARATQEDPNIPVPGANDGASGVAAILELSILLSRYNSSEIGFVLVDAEDQGNDGGGYGMDGWDWIIGSTYFVDNMSQEEKESLRYFILLDMIGNPDLKLKYEGYSTDWLKEEIWSDAATLGYEDTFIPEKGVYLIDDHKPFLNSGIPAADIIDFESYEEWHTTHDNIDAISIDSIAIVTDVIQYFLISNLNLTEVSTTTETLHTSSANLSFSSQKKLNHPLFSVLSLVFLVIIIRRKYTRSVF